MKPWEKYQSQGALGAAEGPWSKYATARDEPAGGETLPGTFESLFAGVNQGLGNVLSLPERAAQTMVTPTMNALRRLAGLPEDTRPSSERSGNILTAIAARVPEAAGESSAAQLRRIARRGGEVAGETMPLSMAGGAIAGAARAVPPLFSLYRTAPVGAAMTDLAAGTGAGIGEQYAKELGGGPWSQLAAALGGGVAGGVMAQGGPPAVLGKIGIEAASRGLSGAQSRMAEMVRNAVGPERTANLSQRLAESEAVTGVIPGFRPSLGERTGDPALLATQAASERAAQGQRLEELSERATGNVEAVRRYQESVAPKADPDIGGVMTGVAEMAERQRGGIAAAQRAVRDRQEAVARALPTIDRTALGAQLREQLLKNKTAEAARQSKRAQELGLNDINLAVPWSEAKERLKQQFKPKFASEDPADYPLAIVHRIGKVGTQVKEGVVTFGEIKALREDIGDKLRDAIGAANPNRKLIRQLVLLRRSVDNEIETAFGAAGADVLARWKQFRHGYDKDYIGRFEKGAAFRVRQENARGFYRTEDEAVAEAFFGPGRVSAVREYKAAVGDTDALGAAALDDLRRFAVRDGVIDPRRLDAWTRAHADVLVELPELQAAVHNAGELAGRLTRRETVLRERELAIGRDLVNREAAAVARGAKTPEAVIEAALKRPIMMRDLLDRVRNHPAAIEALRRHAWDAIENDVVNGLAKYRDSLGQLMSPEHFKSLKTIAAAQEMLARMPDAKGAAFDPNILKSFEKFAGRTVAQVANRIYALKSGRVSKAYLVVDSMAQVFRAKSLNARRELLDKALYDPDFAKNLDVLLTGVGDQRRAYVPIRAWLVEQGFDLPEGDD